MSDTDSKDGLTIHEKTPSTTDDLVDVMPLEQDSCTPLPEDATKRSKKRLREVSVEASTAKVKDDFKVVPIDGKEFEAPPKKNRLQSLEPAYVEETQTAPPTTPPSTDVPLLSTSPPYDSKVRQIRRRVKDLSWQEARRKKPDEGLAGEADQQDEGPETGDATSEGKVEDDDSSKSVSVKSDSDKEEVGRGGGEEPARTDILMDPPIEQSAALSSRARSAASPGTGAPAQADIKRRLSEEPDTEGPTITRVSPDPDACQGKRRRDDGDQNPREPKRISPPPEKEKCSAKSQPVKSTGFMAYASSSPFTISKKAPSVFGTTNPTPVFGSSSIPKPSTSPPFHSITTPSDTQSFNNPAPAAVTFGSSGFNAYVSAASPFAAAKASGASSFGTASTSTSKSPSRVERSKSPGRHANAFGPYTTRPGKFAAAPVRPSKKQKHGLGVDGPDIGDVGTGSGSASGSGDEAGDEDAGSPTTFGDILSAKENQPDLTTDDEKKIEYTEQEVMTGEEGEWTEYQVRAKLFVMAPPPVSGWKERGVGTLKLNVNKKTRRARLVLRTDGVLRLVLNTNLFKGMNFEIAQDPRYVKFGLIVDRRVVLHTLRLGSVKNAEDLLEQVKAYTPGISGTDTAGEV